MRGRKPKPEALKKLEGNLSKRPDTGKEPQFAAVTDLNPPAWLNETAKGLWRQVAPQLSAQGLFSEVDHGPLAALCVAYSRWRKAEELVERQIQESEKPAAPNALELPLAMEFKTPQGYAQQIPQIGIANTYLDKFLKLAAEFGFTPAARARMRVETAPIKRPDDEFFGYPQTGGSAPDAARQVQ
jgi:P27 family predicted phage terminase small subunit